MSGSGVLIGSSQSPVVVGSQRRLERKDGGALVMDQFAVVEFDDAVGRRKIPVIVSDDDDGLAARLQIGKDMVVKDFLELGVLVRGPFVEKIERAIFQVSREQGETLALALREVNGGKFAVLDPDLVVEVKFGEIFLRLA